ncbi:hypothetical protein GN244_ATG19306 [Phytophthora infestans]|uniref:Uncharacterized protein n=1 Tax=Phytophthora infestans TaxID=4787 RepID=A0A833SLW4_PHYIN|nr:hypothetical protein GN244_ATG19306 [Phytophthora infestans]
MLAFEIIAEKCRALDGVLKKDGPALRTRFDRLVRMLCEAQKSSVRASGTTEDWKELADEEKAKERARSQGIETSGKLMRRLSMGEMDQMDEDEEDEQGDDGSVSAAVGGDLTEQQSDDSTSRRCSGEDPVSGRKRAATSGARRVQNFSKRKKLGAVSDSTVSPIERSIGDASFKYEYLRERLQFEREDSLKRLEPEEKRMAAEQDREARREAAEQQRELFSQEFMLKLLQIAMNKTN